MTQFSIGFLGAGRMATALGKGFVTAGLVDAERLIASDPIDDARTAFARETQGRVSHSNSEVVAKADILFLAVKPHQVVSLLVVLKLVLDTVRQMVI